MRDLLTLQQVAEHFDIPYERCKWRLNKADIKPVEIVGRNNFYTPDVLQLLPQILNDLEWTGS